ACFKNWSVITRVRRNSPRASISTSPSSCLPASAKSRFSVARPRSFNSDALATPLRFVRGVGPRRAADLERVGLHTVEDFLFRFPLRYENRAELLTIASLRPGQTATIIGEVISTGIRSTSRTGFRLF